MSNVRLADAPVWEIAVTGDVFDGIFLCCPFSHEMSWMRSGTYLSQFLRVFLPILTFLLHLLNNLIVNNWNAM